MGDKVIEEEIKNDLKCLCVAVGAILNEYDGFTFTKEGNTVVGFGDRDGQRFYFNTNEKTFVVF